jgi:CheY-like chemotaxis protein
VQPRAIDLLVVDDDELDVMNIERALAAAAGGGIGRTVFACDGLDALQLLRTGQVARDRLIVLLDLRMPRMGGLEMLAELRRDPELADVPVIVLTTSDDERDRRDAFAHHVAGYFVKPSSAAEYRQLVAAVEGYWTHCEGPPPS